jgi:hypothetical protein
MTRPWWTKCCTVWLLAALGTLPDTQAATAPEGNRTQLLAAYRLLEPRLRLGTGNTPLTVETSTRDGLVLGNIYAILDHPYGKVTQALRNAHNWCDIVPLHMNMKACTTQPLHTGTHLTLYAGRKSYQPPGQARALSYTYRVQTLDSDYFSATLTADKAEADSPPVALEAIPLDGERVLIHVRYAWRTPLWLRVATDSYFATVGARKVGFSTTGTDLHGEPEYVGGLHGAIERNALRYYLALDSYFSTDQTTEAGRFEQRLNRWFDLTEHYPAQLHEMNKADYLWTKRKERTQQLKMQQQLDARR